MTRIVLLRHAHSVANAAGILAGRTPAIALSKDGVRQSLEVADRLTGVTFSAIRISPMERCAETVKPLLDRFSCAELKRISIEKDEDLIEVDYGKWTGKKLATLSRDKAWQIVQDTPSAMYFPGGEGLLDVQARAMRALNRVAHLPGSDVKVLVSHGDVIKAILASVLGTHLDHFQKIVIDPASLSILDFNGTNFRVLTMNNTATEVASFLAKSKKAKSLKALVGGGSGREN